MAHTFSAYNPSHITDHSGRNKQECQTPFVGRLHYDAVHKMLRDLLKAPEIEKVGAEIIFGPKNSLTRNRLDPPAAPVSHLR